MIEVSESRYKRLCDIETAAGVLVGDAEQNGGEVSRNCLHGLADALQADVPLDEGWETP